MSERTWTIEQLREAVLKSKNYISVLRLLNLRALSSYKTIHKYIDMLCIDTSHFEKKEDVYKRTLGLTRAKKTELCNILKENNGYSRTHLKNKLYKEGIKNKKCELCGQGEIWHGKKISLILDHINGVNNDHRLENLRIVCPNCAATLDTHCGKNTRKYCPVCGESVKSENKVFCSIECSSKAKKGRVFDDPKLRKIIRPQYSSLIEDVKTIGYSGTGRKYGVSDNAIRKWIRHYEKLGCHLAVGCNSLKVNTGVRFPASQPSLTYNI